MTHSTINIKVPLYPHTAWMSCFHSFFHPNCQQTLPNSDELTFFGLSGIKGYGLTVYGRGPRAPRPSLKHSVETCSFFFPETYSGLLMRTCGVQLSILCLNKACWWIKVCSSLRIELDESKTPAEESSLELLDSQELWTSSKCDVSSEKGFHLPKTQRQEQHSCPQHAWEAYRATFSLWSHGRSSVMPADDKICGISVPTEPYRNCWSLEENINSNRKKSCPLEEESRWGWPQSYSTLCCAWLVVKFS